MQTSEKAYGTAQYHHKPMLRAAKSIIQKPLDKAKKRVLCVFLTFIKKRTVPELCFIALTNVTHKNMVKWTTKRSGTISKTA